jgi:two-component system OmpR family sensor kinase
MIQVNKRVLVHATSPQKEPPGRTRPLLGSDSGRTRGIVAQRNQAARPLTRVPRGRLRTQLTLAFAAAMTLFCGLFVAASCASSPSVGLTLRTSVCVAVGLFGAATLAAWWVLGRALRPLAQLAACADGLDGSWANKSVIIAGDQIEVHRARTALDRALTRLHDCQVALDLFVSNVAHELQDPVTTVLAEAQGMTVGEQSVEALASFARSARHEVTRIGKIVSGSLTLARLDSAQHHGTLDPVCMLDIALDVVKNAHARAEEQDVRLVLLLPESEELQIRADAELVTSMLENVVSNAVAYSPRGEEIRIHLERADEDLRITVRDRGPGVPELLLPHVLEAHVHGSRKSRGARGKGLGLAIASRVAHYHGGAIRIANHADGGCEVVIALPLHRPRASQQSRGRSSLSVATA